MIYMYMYVHSNKHVGVRFLLSPVEESGILQLVLVPEWAPWGAQGLAPVGVLGLVPAEVPE